MITAYRWDSNWKILLLVIVLAPILLWLGFWQLQRAEEKQTLQEHFDQQMKLPPIALDMSAVADDGRSINYRRVALAGEFNNSRPILLDNRVYHGVVGYEVLSPFIITDGKVLLVNRGWIKGSLDRRQLPDIPPVQGLVDLVATIYVPYSKPIILQDDQWSQKWPLVVQWEDINRLGMLLHVESIFPYSVRLEAGQPGALDIDWAPINTKPEKHRGYAVQWFSMAAALLAFWLYSSIRPRKEIN